MKKIISVITVCLMCLLMAVPAFADGKAPLLVDDAHLLSTSEKEAVLDELAKTSEALGMDVVIHTTDGTGGKGITPYADAFLEDNGYGQGSTRSAIALVVDMDARNFAVSTMGDAIYYFTDYGVNEVLDEVQAYLSNGDYAGAFRQYADVVSSMVAYKDSHGYAWGEDTAANTDTNFDKEKASRSSGEAIVKIIIAVLVGFGLSFAATKGMVSKMKNVRMKASASDYYNEDELRITAQRDTFLYHTLSKVPIKQDNNSGRGGGGFSTHVSSGGFSHGGGSRHF